MTGVQTCALPISIGDEPGIIANPNCSTIQMVVVLKPIHDKYKIKRVVVSTYQSVSGSGQRAIEELQNQTKNLLAGKITEPNVYPHQIAFNCIPHIDNFLDSGYTKEDRKSTRLNSSHALISYAVFCLKKKK